ncbi:hypothetical protein SAMN05421839_1459 [Halolactibacillus halophilus]|uniref:DUF327 family protein n=1 Tax=Halolactibacillus halophilus TaxID=306540 RepID=A0A1I5SHY8_9BACI|nr:YaaR family protein [Halolactibacillus halophilus]GEM02586.1 hypothetical protein HHA03_21180 [Halolactibacillus halophilus]SFP70380.1 hypothetical protein SAMN05421839_1459 [Halolactibacillus halophilus]
MKINKDILNQIEKSQRQQPLPPSRSVDFQKLVQTQADKLRSFPLEQQLEEIKKQGDKLIRYRTLREMAKYKRMVKSFIKDATSKGLDLSHHHSFNIEGTNRQLHIVKTIDEKLMEMTEQITNDGARSIDLLGLIGEIKGLLINLYS